ncbi:MAG: aminopeptidase [Thermoleophilia bacterium]|nr:aminopeptidase [Thermoleophilia bacterium]
MTDARVERYAELLLDTCLGVQRGWQVMVWSTPWARPLLEEVMKQLGERGAYPLLRLTFSGGLVYHRAWLRHAPLEAISEPASVDVHALGHCDAVLAIAAPENTRDGVDITAERTSAVQGAYRRATSRLHENEVPWVMCWYPTPAVAQDAGMTLPAFEDFLYGSCLIDWDAEHKRISRYAKLFDEAEEVRIVGEGTDLRLSVAGRRTDVDAGFGNMPGGEFFVCPVETSAEGTIAFTEFPAVWSGREMRGVRLRFSEGWVVDASAETEEDFLLQTLDTDEGARRIGELGIGCNPGIDRYMRNVYFDEKMDGTVHVALGTGFDYVGGTNESAIHWDIVKDLRSGGSIELDGKVVQENGVWAV